MSDALKESSKELGRLALFGLVGVVIAYFSDLPQTQTTLTVLAVLRWADKWLHENAKVKVAKDRKTGLFGLKGLSGF